jgi:hypothetical protein
MRPRLAFLVAQVLVLTIASAAHAATFGVSSFDATVEDASHQPVSQAGAHPFAATTSFTFNTSGGTPVDNVRNIRVDLPPGLISNPQAANHCTESQFDTSSCPADSQVGTEELALVLLGLQLSAKAPVYNMVTANGLSDFAPALEPRTDIVGGVRDTTDGGLFFTISNVTNLGVLAGIKSTKLTFWGVPSDVGHDAERGQTCLNGLCSGGGTAVARTDTAFVSLPTACSGPQTTKLTVSSWGGSTDTATSTTPVGADGCAAVPFDPSISVTPGTTQADEPTSTTIDLHVPQSSDAETLATAHVKDTSVTLPEGMTINPAAANGLASCTDSQFAKGTHDPVACPAASRIGDASIATQVLPAPGLTGSVYLGAPVPDDPFRLFVEVHGFGLSVRLAGSVHPAPGTGRLTAKFADTPQLPFTDFVLAFDGGPGATLATPLACGQAASTSSITPYTGQPAATPTAAFTVDADGQGGACPPTPFNLGFAAGAKTAQAGAFSPFGVDVTRADRQNLLSRLTISEPPGMLGVLSSVPLCPDADAASGTCSADSRIGTVGVKAGAGPKPFGLSGPVFLTGPYNGAPFGLSIVIRVLAGPFDLGSIVVRAAISIDPKDAHLTILADPLPQILQGIPLRIREVGVVIDRPGFSFNPSACDPLTVHGTLVAIDGAVQEADAPFQATGCGNMRFTPTLSAVADGRTSAASGAGLKITLRQPPLQANVRSVSVQLPPRLTARGSTAAAACPEATFNADPAACAGSRVGSVRAETPLLSEPLAGPVYLVAHSSGLPTLEALPSGQGIHLGLSGTVSLAASGVTSAFDHVPDVPISRFVLDLPRGPHSALSAAKGVCGAALTMRTTIVGQNGARVANARPITVTGCGLKILGARVKGTTVTLTVRVSRKGRLIARGPGMRSARRTITKGANLRLVMRLSKAGRETLARRRSAHRHLKVRIAVRLGTQRAATTVTFR